MKHSRIDRRAGFTLIELLVVISIIALLMALSAGAFFRVRASQTKTNSIATVKKVDGALHARWSSISNSAKDEIRNKSTPAAKAALSEAGNDADVALTLLLYAKMRNELPTNFVEATTATPIGMSSTSLQPRKHFVAAIPLPVTSTGSPEESGVCLFIALTNSGGDGAVAEGGLDQQAISTTIGPNTYRTFGDAWGTPLAFVRHAYPLEVQGPPYVPTGKTAFDPFDPSPSHKANATLTGTRWAQIRAFAPSTTIFVPVASNMPLTYTPTGSGTATTPGANFVPTVISAGPNKIFLDPDIFNTASDNLYGFRLRREGSQGN
jgi:prepilin-type N-terminal cleavage/methylation domain-containing protein